MRKIIEKICSKYNIQLRTLKLYTDEYTNRCSCAKGNNPEIFIGEYENDELLLISFFHEFGHMYAIFGRLATELEAWKWGIRYAKKCGISFSKKTLGWSDIQLQTYKSKK